MSVNHSVRRHNRDNFSMFFNKKVCCVFSVESPHRGDSNETHNIPFSREKTKTTQNILNLQPGDFSKGLKNEFETAVVNEPSVFEPLKFYCNQF